MSEDKSKKPKIDLKARLGKTNIGTQSVPLPVPGSSQPPPSGAGAASKPQGIAPPPGISPGIPVPLYAQQQKPAQAEAPAPKPTAVQQTIKVEVGEEIIKEREKAKKTLIGVAAGVAVVGGIIGFLIGGLAASNKRQTQAVESATALEKDLKAANDKMKDLDLAIADGLEQLRKQEYPTKLATDLAGIFIPFDATKLDGARLGALKPTALRQLLNYTSGVEDLNQKKDKLKSLLDFAKAPIEKGWKEDKEPVVGFSVIFRSEPKGVVAELLRTKTPFEFGKDWPASYEVLKPERTQQGMKNAEKKGSRYTKGDLPGSGGDPIVIPVDPASTAVFTSQEDIRNLSKAILDVSEELKGHKNPNNPADDTDGLIEVGSKLVTELQKFKSGG